MQAIYWVAAFGVGVLLPLQVGVNTQLRSHVGSPLVATLISFAVGTLALLLVTAATRTPWPSIRLLGAMPIWLWSGGLLGMLFVGASIVLGPKIGAAALVGWVIAGQLLMSVVLDHFGLVGFAVHPISALRVLGIVLLIAGAALVVRS